MRRSIILPILVSALVLASCQATGGKKRKPKSDNKVTGVFLNRGDVNFNLNPNHRYDHEQLIATVEGEGEYSTDVTWSSSDTSVANVDDGYVTAVGLGEATITATSVQDDSFSAACAITVIDDVPVVTGVTVNPGSSTIDLKNEVHTLQLVAVVEGLNAPSQEVTWKSADASKVSVSDSGLVTALAKTNGVKITATSKENTSFSGEATISVIDTTPRVTKVEIQKNNVTISTLALDIYEPKGLLNAQLTAKVSGENDYSQEVTWSSDEPNVVEVSETGLVTAKSITHPSVNIYATSKMDPTVKATVKVTVSNSTPEVTDVTVNPNQVNLSVGKTSTITATVLGTNLTTEDQKSVTWSSSDTSVTVKQKDYHTVEITGVREAKGVQVIATSSFNKNAYGVCTVDVKETVGAAYTIMIYMCGSDLETNNQFATSDLREILSVSNQPEGVNIIIETGGAKSWSRTYGISSDKLERWHVENKSLVKDQQLSTYASMGLSSTFQSFMEWGLTSYPAEKTGVILWNHGGGMDGCCYDEKKSYDGLTIPEAITGLKNAFKNANITDKLEWIGYDCCLMQCIDAATVNADYFHYQVASQESEEGEGWDYDNWLDNLYANPSIDTPTLLKEICDTFVSDNGGDSSRNDQVLSYLKLDNMANFVSAFNDWSSSYNTRDKFTSVNSAFKSALQFSSGLYGSVDLKSLLTKLSVPSTSILMSTLTDIVGYNRFSSQYSAYKSTNPCGVNAFVASSSVDADYRVVKSAYTSSATKLTYWQSMNYNYGTFY